MANCGRCSVEVASDWGPHACLLPQVWSLFPGTLHEVVCVESLGRAVIERESRRHTVSLEPVDYDDTLGTLLAVTVALERKFDGRPGIIFRPWLFQRLSWAAVDHWRSAAGFGRHGQHRVASPPPLDDGDAGGDRREFALLDPGSDPAGRAAALGGLLAAGDREADAPVGILGLAAGGGAEGGAAGGNGAVGERAAAAGGGASQAYVDCLACGWRTYLAAPNGIGRWHVPDWCSGCGAPLGLQAAEAAA